MKLVQGHSASVQAIASGLHALPNAGTTSAATQGAFRFLHNARVTLPVLAGPLVEFAQQETAAVCDDFVLVVHDWSQLMYSRHTAKKDRLALSSTHVPDGYELLTALLVSDRNGLPIAPVEMGLRAADGVHCSRSETVLPPLSPLDELLPVMQHVDQLSLPRPRVHLIDAEADSIDHFRQWSRAGQVFLVRADDRLVQCEGSEQRLSAIQAQLRAAGQLQATGEVLYHGRRAKQFVGEAPVTLTRAAQRNRPKAGDRSRIPGVPLKLRLVVAEVRDLEGKLLATWFLLTNVPASVPAERIALWYYWRWGIEKFFKLLKSAGLELEEWQQESAAALARRLWIACMACVTVWQLAHNPQPEAKQMRQLLVRLSGRQVKRGVEYTLPALLAGMWTLLAMLEVMQDYTLADLRRLAEMTLAHPPPKTSLLV